MTELRRNRCNLLFVYGSLMSCARGPMGAVERRRLRWQARRIGWATVPGRLQDLGGYPGWRPAAGSVPAVQGELWRLVDGRRLLSILDAYEGVDDEPALYRRIVTVVRCADGRRVWAWAYAWTGVGANAPDGRREGSAAVGRWRG